jgi:hypothetical protein
MVVEGLAAEPCADTNLLIRFEFTDPPGRGAAAGKHDQLVRVLDERRVAIERHHSNARLDLFDRAQLTGCGRLRREIAELVLSRVYTRVVEIPMSIDVEFLKQVYERFNARDIEAVLAALHPDVTWANGMEGGHVYGREAVRSYWTRQWAAITPRVEPTSFSISADGEIVVDVHQTVRDLHGTVLADRMVGHIFRIENGLITRFDISEA